MNQKPINNSAIFALFNDRERDLIVSAINCKARQNTDACEMINNVDAHNALMAENKILYELAELFLFEYVWVITDADDNVINVFESRNEAQQFFSVKGYRISDGYLIEYRCKKFIKTNKQLKK